MESMVRYTVAAIALVASSLRVSAQNVSLAADRAPDSSARAVAVRAQTAPVIDGREDDAVWRAAVATGDFREFQPTEGKAPRFRTEFKAAFDDRNLYVFVRMFDAHPDSIMRALSRRDVRGPSDQIKLLIDSYFDRRNGYEFAVNPDGVKRDYAMYNDRDEDDSWDAIWDAAARVDSTGWTAEFRIPLSQMRFGKREGRTIGFGIWRDIERYKERVAWPTYSQSRNGLTSQLGHLEGVNVVSFPQRLEVTPYTVAKSTSRTTMVNSRPTYDRVQQGTMGADLKLGLGPNITLDGTVNPDFGQVEADPSVLNLSAFETFFQEKRPFFVEGTGLYQFGVNCNIVNCSGEGLFYSRRIGREPSLRDAYGNESSPTSTPILGAAKLTGRMPSGLALGVLQAVTQHLNGTDSRTIEPQTSYTVLRAVQELRQGKTTIGLVGTGVSRSLDQWTRNDLRRGAYVGGADFSNKLPGGNYEVSGSVMLSRVDGTRNVIAATQLDQVHYYQQPDAGLVFDSTRTSLSGDAEEIHFGKMGGGIVRFQSSYQRQSAGFEINDLGYLQRADEQSHATWFALQFRKPTKVYRSLQMNFNEWNFWTDRGMMTETGVNTNWHMNLQNNWWVHAGGTVNALAGSLCDRCSRGGPAVRRLPSMYPWFGFNGDDRKRIVPSLFFNFGRSLDGRTHSLNTNGGLDIRPSSAIQASVGYSVTSSVDDEQWYGNFVTGTTTHYTFAHLRQWTYSLNTRASYTITPTLTFQLYAQPFVTKGAYSNVRELTATPRADDFDDRYQPYAVPAGSRAGFNVRQLRSNSVLRWEYRPGSALFVVWTHGRDSFDPQMGSMNWRQEYDKMFALHPDNTFLIKLAYWLSR